MRIIWGIMLTVSGFGDIGIVNYGLYVLNINTMAIKRQGILNRKVLGLCYEHSRRRCAHNMWWLATESFLDLSYARTIWYYADNRGTKDFIRIWQYGVMSVIWRYSHAVMKK